MLTLRILIVFTLLACVALPARAERFSAPSDPEAVRLARRVVRAMGGREAWNETRYLAWNFYGRRFHVWDTWTGDLRTEFHEGGTALMNLNTNEGRFVSEGADLEGEALEDALSKTRSAWINDSYWLVMPFKLFDEGVRLRGPRSVRQEDGTRALALRLTFDGVGRTPWNAYEVHVSPDTHRVTGWAFFRNAADREPSLVTPWHLERRGRLLLPTSHGRGGDWEVEVFDEIPRTVFTADEPRLDLTGLLAIATPAGPMEMDR